MKKAVLPQENGFKRPSRWQGFTPHAIAGATLRFGLIVSFLQSCLLAFSFLYKLICLPSLCPCCSRNFQTSHRLWSKTLSSHHLCCNILQTCWSLCSLCTPRPSCRQRIWSQRSYLTSKRQQSNQWPSSWMSAS